MTLSPKEKWISNQKENAQNRIALIIRLYPRQEAAVIIEICRSLCRSASKAAPPNAWLTLIQGIEGGEPILPNDVSAAITTLRQRPQNPHPAAGDAKDYADELAEHDTERTSFPAPVHIALGEAWHQLAQHVSRLERGLIVAEALLDA